MMNVDVLVAKRDERLDSIHTMKALSKEEERHTSPRIRTHTENFHEVVLQTMNMIKPRTMTIAQVGLERGA